MKDPLDSVEHLKGPVQYLDAALELYRRATMVFGKVQSARSSSALWNRLHTTARFIDTEAKTILEGARRVAEGSDLSSFQMGMGQRTLKMRDHMASASKDAEELGLSQIAAEYSVGGGISMALRSFTEKLSRGKSADPVMEAIEELERVVTKGLRSSLNKIVRFLGEARDHAARQRKSGSLIKLGEDIDVVISELAGGMVSKAPSKIEALWKRAQSIKVPEGDEEAARHFAEGFLRQALDEIKS